MRLLGTISSAILALIAIPLFTVAACNLAMEAAIFNRSTYDAVLEDRVIFEEMLSVALPVVLAAPEADIDFEGRDQSSVLLQDIVVALEGKPEVWAQITDLLIPADWLQNTSNQLADVIFSIIDGNIDVIDDEVDMSDIRARFLGEQAQEAASLIITEAPICTAEELSTLESILEGQQGVTPICDPQDEELTNGAIDLVNGWFQLLGQDFAADRIPVAQMFDMSRDDARAFSIFMELVFEQALILFYLCPTALISLIIIFVVRTLKGFGRWIGGILIAVGVLILLTIFALQAFAFGTIGDAVSMTSHPAGEFLARFASAMLRSAIAKSSSSLLFQAGLFIGIGFVFFAVAWYFGRNRDDEGSVVIITDDGEVISTATQRRIGNLNDAIDDDQAPN